MLKTFGMKMAIAAFAAASLWAQNGAEDGLLVIAHGARMEGWNERVIKVVEKVEWPGPKVVAFLTARTPDQELLAAADRLDKMGVKRIVVVPLLVSSFSDHYEEIRYYAGDRKTAPEHHTHGPLKTRAEVLLTPGMDADWLLGMVLSDEVRATSSDAGKETVILVAHGPNDDGDDAKWLACLRVQAGFIQASLGFQRVDAATIRDDASPEVKAAAVASLRERVKRYSADTKVLIQPVLISKGHVQAEIAELLQGLEFQMSESGVSSHALTAEWIRHQAILRLRIAAHRQRQ